MSENNWYTDSSWYAPADSSEKAGRTETVYKKPKHSWLIVVGCIALLLALIVGSSLLFRDKLPEMNTTVHFGDGDFGQSDDYGYDGSEEMPDDWKDFFSGYYTEVDDEAAILNMPRYDGKLDFSLELQASDGKELSLQELYVKCAHSIVAIRGYMEDVVGYNWGTGVIISANGIILTNTHVIDGCDTVKVVLYDDREYDALLIGGDTLSDIAILKIDASGLPAAEFGKSDELVVGDKVAAIGNPLSESFRMTLTDGIISAIGRGVSHKGHSMTVLQTNTAINSGNSGGALFNMYGQVIGITNMKMMSSYTNIEGIGFAIPSTTVQSIVAALIADGEVRGRPSIGVTVGAIPDTVREYYGNLPAGLYVSAVSEDSDAAAKGILPGDIITEVNGVAVTTTDQVTAMKEGLQVGDTMSFTVWRNGEVFRVDVELYDTNDVYK